MKYHGLKRNGEGGAFRFGFLRLLHQTQGLFCFPRNTPEESRPIWQEKCFDRFFLQAVTKFQETLWKYERVSDLLSQSMNLFITHKESKKMEEFAKFLQSHKDIPIYIDSLIFYLRIHADLIANCVPYLYGKAGKNSIPPHSFRDQRDWFIKKQPSFDKKYTQILASNLSWFDTLSSDDRKGLREVLTHYRGTYQLGWDQSDIPTVSIHNEAGFISENVIPTLQTLVRSYFIYLDATYMHFFTKMQNAFGEQYYRNPEDLSLLYTLTPYQSRWIYPNIE